MIRQQKDGWCGPASLQYALKQQGVKLSQPKIAQITQTTVRGGVDPKNLQNGVKKVGLQSRAIVNKSPEKTLQKLSKEVKQGKSVIVDYLSGRSPKLREDGHYSVLKRVTKDKVTLWDPSPGRTKTIAKSSFIKNWKDTTKNNNTFKHYGLIISKKG